MQHVQSRVPPAFQLAHLQCHSVKTPDSATEWTDLGLRSDLLAALKEGLKLKTPLATQISGIQPLMKSKRVLFAAQTGSGKTLSYLLPLFQRLKAEEESSDKNALRKKSSPRALILLPTRELVKQVYKVAKGLSHYCKLKVETSDSVEKDDFVDILITTPRAFSDNRALKSDSISHIIVDEADTLMTGNFLAETKAVLKEDARLIATSATITKALQRSLQSLYPDLKIIAAQGLHEAVPQVRQRFINITQPGNEKIRRLIEIVQSSPTSSFIIFCNKLSKAEQVHSVLSEALQQANTQVLPSLFHGNLPTVQRSALIDQFSRGQIRVLVCTDLAARGLDTSWVNHVINYDFPRSIQDYLHRIGRTARAGRGGVVTSFVTGKDEGLFEYIQLAVKQNAPFSRPLPAK